MSVVECTSCRKEISKNASRCPNCGQSTGHAFPCKTCQAILYLDDMSSTSSRYISSDGTISTAGGLGHYYLCTKCGEKHPRRAVWPINLIITMIFGISAWVSLYYIFPGRCYGTRHPPFDCDAPFFHDAFVSFAFLIPTLVFSILLYVLIDRFFRRPTERSAVERIRANRGKK